MSKNLARIAAVATLTALCVASGVSPAAAAGPGCTPDVYFELDAHGYVTGYPGARCTPGEYFGPIGIDSTLQVDGQYVGDSRTTYEEWRAGVLPGRGIAARNGAGSNQFCLITTVGWSTGLGAKYRNSRNCVVY